MKSNREFWERLISACLTYQIEWNWMPRKAGDAFQETADRLSRAAATRKESLDKNTLDRLAWMMVEDKPDESTVKMIPRRTENISRRLRWCETSGWTGL